MRHAQKDVFLALNYFSWKIHIVDFDASVNLTRLRATEKACQIF